MPCYITGSRAGDLALSRDEAAQEAQDVTRLLCEVMEALERNGLLMNVPPKARKWWTNHKKKDKK